MDEWVGALACFGFFVFMLILWPLWMWFCLLQWIKNWAKRNGVKLIESRICRLNRGPYWYTLIPFPPSFSNFTVYYVVVENPDGQRRKGWVWLDFSYFFGGKGQVTWDSDWSEDVTKETDSVGS